MIWRPWRHIRHLQKVCEDYRSLTARLNRELSNERAVSAQLMSDNLILASGAASDVPADHEVCTGNPEFVMVGIARPDGTKRLIASRVPSVLSFGMTGMDDPPPRWKIHATMPNAAFIDRGDYAQATAQLWTMWANADAEAARTAPKRQLTGPGTEPYGKRTGSVSIWVGQGGAGKTRAELEAGTLSQLGYNAPEPLVTKSGRELTAGDVQELADEAEAGYPVLPPSDHSDKETGHFREWHAYGGVRPHAHTPKEH